MKNQFAHFNRALIRKPLFQFGDLLNGGWKQVVLESDKFQESIFWASPMLYQELVKLKNGEIQGEKREKLWGSLYKYFVRMSSRCTPFGICAGVSLHEINKSYEGLEKRVVTPDFEFLTELIANILKKDEIFSVIDFYKNPSLYRIGDSYRYYEKINNNKESFTVSSIKASPEVEKVLTVAENGSRLNQLMQVLGEDYSFSSKKDFIFSLIYDGVLISEWEYRLLDNNIIGRITDKLEEIRSSWSDTILHLLKHCTQLMDRLQRVGLGDKIYLEVDSLKLDFKKELNFTFTGQLFHVDLLKSVPDDCLSENDTKKIFEAINVMVDLQMFAKAPSLKLMADFKKVYFERYDNEEVELSKVLDSDSGIGFPVQEDIGGRGKSFLLEQLNIQHVTDEVEFSMARDTVKLPYESKGIDLSKYVTGSFPVNTKLPPTFTVMFSKLPSGSYLMQDVGGASALGLLSRFGLKDKAIKALLADIWEKENEFHENTVVAEIVYVPQGKEGNVVKRPCGGRYYIPVNGGVICKGAHAIQPKDLWVSVKNGEVVLFCKKLEKRIVPRLPSAHNYFRSTVPLYRFLCAVQFQHKTLSLASLQVTGANLKSPRIFYKKIIFKPASWKLEHGDYSAFIEKQGVEGLIQFIGSFGMPRWIAIKEGDNEFPIDTQDQSSLKVLRRFLDKKRPIEIIEWLHFTEGLSENPHYTNQVILPVQTIPVKRVAIPQFKKSHIEPTIPRTFLPGSQIFSLKIYCGAFYSDMILHEMLATLGKQLIKLNWVSSFFFIRYRDPHYHLRIRFFLNTNKPNSFEYVLSECMRVAQDLEEKQLLWKVDISTYNREMERYGAKNIEFVERIFYHDSVCILDLEQRFSEDEKAKTLYAVANVDYWLKLMNYKLNEKLKIVTIFKESYKMEFADKLDFKAINSLYRSLKTEMIDFFEKTDFVEFRSRNSNISKDGLTMPSEGLLSLEQCLIDLIHMSQNRLFSTDQRIQEYLVYEMLEKFYKYCQVRHKNKI